MPGIVLLFDTFPTTQQYPPTCRSLIDGPAQAQALAIVVGQELRVQQRGHAHAFHPGQQQRHVVHPFCVNGQILVHHESLPDLGNPVYI